MSRGPGRVMRAVQLLVLDGPREKEWTYDTLAAVIYGSDVPTRPQLSAVARAAGRLAEHGHVHIEAAPWDARFHVVRHADPLQHAERLLQALPTGASYSYEALAGDVYWTSWPSGSELGAIGRAIDELARVGRARVLNQSEATPGRPRVVSRLELGARHGQ